jgi:gamma-glutamyl phosphate reductase
MSNSQIANSPIRAMCRMDQRLKPATDDDWATEYLSPVLAMKVVDGPDDALAHIARYGSGHTDGIGGSVR